MSYIVNADIEIRVGSAAYVQLSDDDGDGQADTAVIDEIRLAAESQVNSYLARRYAVPIDLVLHTDLADLLKSITLDLAEYRLWCRRPPVSRDGVEKHAHAVAWLTGVASGSIALPSAKEVASNTTRGSLATTTGEERLLSRDELSNH